MNRLFYGKNGWLPAMCLLLALMTLPFSACEETADDCKVAITDFSLSSTTVSPGATITGSFTVNESIGLDDLVLRGIVDLYLSNDATFSSDDEPLTSFTSAPTSSGSNTTVGFSSIDIPFGLADGEYYVLAHISSQPCTGGGTAIPEETEWVKITVV